MDSVKDQQIGPRGPVIVVIAGSIAVLAVLGYLALSSFFARDAVEQTPQRAQFFAASIDDTLTRLEHLPHVLSIAPATLDALQSADVTALNRTLADIAARSRAEFIYVLDINGQTIASSNYEDADSLVGNYYTFRPYFQDALAGMQGRFYAVGVTTGRPGYFIAEPVRGADGTIFGVVAIKIGFAELSESLSDSGALVLVSDRQGVVLTSSDPDLIYGHLSPLSTFDRQSLADQQQFGDQTLFPLDWSAQSETRARLDGTDYIWTQASLTNEDWTLHLLSDIGDIRRQALLYVAVALLTCLGLIVAAAMYRAAQLRNALAISDADRRRLAREIEERQRVEANLETARSALARKNQLAALGQLSASITHELGQPISAMRNYLVAEEIVSDAKPGGLWPEMTGLVDRMQRILDQLRLFGRRNPDEEMSFAVQDTVKAALQLVQHTADAGGVTVNVTQPDAPIQLRGHPGRFEQVIVNLLRNAIDATADVPQPHVALTLDDTGAEVVLTVADNGTGLGDLDITALREPFFSTKPSGKGMGLGLAISGQVVNEMGGVLQAETRAVGGAAFSTIFPKDVAKDA